MRMSCNSHPNCVPVMSNNKSQPTFQRDVHCQGDSTKSMFGRRKSFLNENCRPTMVHSMSMGDLRAVDTRMQSVEFASQFHHKLFNCSSGASDSSEHHFSSAASDCSEFSNEQINSGAIQSCPNSGNLRPMKSEPIYSSDRVCHVQVQDALRISKTQSMFIIPHDSVRGTSAPTPETGIPRVISSRLEPGYYTQSHQGNIEPVDIYSLHGNIVRTSEGNIMTTPRLTPNSMSREMSMTSNASFTSNMSSPSGSTASNGGFPADLNRVHSWPNLGNGNGGHIMPPLILSPTAPQYGFHSHQESSQFVASGQSQFVYQNSSQFVQVLPFSPPTPQYPTQITTPTVPSKPARTVVPPSFRFPARPPIYRPNLRPNHGDKINVKPHTKITQPKKKKDRTPQKTPNELGDPVDRPGIGAEGGTITAEKERELREIYKTIEVGEWHHPNHQKITICLDGLGKDVKIGYVKPVIKAMGGMRRARDLGVTIPLDETSPEMYILDEWNAMKKNKDTIGIKKLAAKHGFDAEEGIRVPNHGFAYLTFNGVNGKRNAQRVYSIVQSCDKGDIKGLRCVWNPPSNSVTGKGRPAFLDS